MKHTKRVRLEAHGWRSGQRRNPRLVCRGAALVETKLRLSRAVRERAPIGAITGRTRQATQLESVARGQDGSRRSHGLGGPAAEGSIRLRRHATRCGNGHSHAAVLGGMRICGRRSTGAENQ